MMGLPLFFQALDGATNFYSFLSNAVLLVKGAGISD